MIGTALQFTDLQELTGYNRLSDVERCLDQAGIRYFRGKGGIWTTMGLIEAAGGIKPANADAPYDPDMAA
jgi:hypothetical protein